MFVKSENSNRVGYPKFQFYEKGYIKQNRLISL